MVLCRALACQIGNKLSVCASTQAGCAMAVLLQSRWSHPFSLVTTTGWHVRDDARATSVVLGGDRASPFMNYDYFAGNETS